MTYPERVRIVEVGPRDGLQNEPTTIPTAAKVALIEALADAGLTSIEAGSFVSPRWVPQMADTAAVLAQLRPRPGLRYPVLVPNLQGLERARACGVREVAVFAAASESFSRRNINCSIAESLERFAPVVETARAAGLRVRGYVSCVLGCPYEGAVAAAAVTQVAEALLGLGCYEISLGDTIGTGTPLAARRLVEGVAAAVPLERIALHFHDTYGQALANLLACLDLGVSVIDSAVAGLGGCPYARGATGNVATEDVAYMLRGMGIETGIDLEALVDAGLSITRHLNREPASKAARAILSRRQAAA
ncbi:hydroxymethylglutaryl-CoA lyase [Methylobacterium brachiatum]|uniref:hydroxymethylglutaryl-CoA lyase n=1 Tax=Methylobacterium brachiatum TaxID=269660 RepID=A0AAJ1TVQ5_9HYPH|nr:hydroxymethylglutaryl-CoA lyase [Methylobacterium brachiatum]MCB4801503.1 hydroxymethylglutaryl-CoA lyase [Methylobacterium brachiatum]MDQ0544292.1 hydroxymethylglutaryl-CoA lyase [Methylobacterium brachiatum]